MSMFLAALVAVHGVIPADVPWFDAKLVEAQNRALIDWYGCMKQNLPTFARKRSITATEAADAIMAQCQEKQARHDQANEAVLDSSAAIGPSQARDMAADHARARNGDTRLWLIGEVAKVRP